MPRDVDYRTLPYDPAMDMHSATKQYAERVKVSGDDTDAKHLEDKIVAGDNVTITKLNPAGDEQLEIAADAAPGAFEWAAATTSRAIPKEYATYESYCAVTARIYITRPLRVTRFSHDFNSAGTYDCLLSNGPTIPTRDDRDAVLIAEDVVVASTGLHHFEPTDPMVLSPGFYFLTFRHSDGTSTHQWNSNRPGAGYAPEDDGESSVGNDLFRVDQGFGDGQRLDGPHQLPHVSLTAYIGTWRD